MDYVYVWTMVGRSNCAVAWHWTSASLSDVRYTYSRNHRWTNQPTHCKKNAAVRSIPSYLGRTSLNLLLKPRKFLLL